MNVRPRLEQIKLRKWDLYMGSSYRAIKPFPAAKAADVSGIVIPVGWLIELVRAGYIQS